MGELLELLGRQAVFFKRNQIHSFIPSLNPIMSFIMLEKRRPKSYYFGRTFPAYLISRHVDSSGSDSIAERRRARNFGLTPAHG
jgi:hypothetical protein